MWDMNEARRLMNSLLTYLVIPSAVYAYLSSQKPANGKAY